MAAYILVVDDDQAIRTFVGLAPKDEGYTVKLASDGIEALGLAGSEQPTLILLDMRMPKMDGAAFIQKYRAMTTLHAPIILMSAGHTAAEVIGDVSVSGFLSKPFNLKDMLKVVKEQIP